MIPRADDHARIAAASALLGNEVGDYDQEKFEPKLNLRGMRRPDGTYKKPRKRKHNSRRASRHFRFDSEP